MTKAKGRPQKGRLADMTIMPADVVEQRYTRPLDEECEDWTYTENLGPGRRLKVAQLFLKGTSKLVHFSLNLQLRDEDGKWHDAARIDTSDGEVHRHQFARSGDNHRTVMEVVPADHGEDVIGRWFDPALDIMMGQWEEFVRGWYR